MKVSDLKTGMLIETKSGQKGLIMRGTPEGDNIAGAGDNSTQHWCPIASHKGNELSAYGIVKVWGYPNNKHGANFGLTDRSLIYEAEKNEIQLTDEYSAKIDKKKKVVNVGCQTIPFEKVKELYKIINE